MPQLALVPAESPALAAWRAGLAAIDPHAFHPPGVLAARRPPRYEDPPWPAVHAAMLAFLDDWGAVAADLGWSAEQLFGVHRQAGAVRADATGALVTLYPVRVEAIEASAIHLVRGTSRQTFRGLTNPDASVPLWRFGQA